MASVLVGCGAKDSPTTAPETSAATPAPRASGVPPLPLEEIRRLADSVTYIDYVFFAQAFSMSMSEPAAIRYAIAAISPEAAHPSSACAAMGRVFYKIGGRTVREADLHFEPGCTYLKFYGSDGRVAYASELSPTGKAFFNNQFRQLLPDYTDIE